MWLWRSIKICNRASAPESILTGVLLSLLGSSFLAQPSYAIPTSSGPTSADEARIIWQEGKQAYLESRYLDVAHYLQRLVDRYPGHSNGDEATELLGVAYYHLNQPARAIPLLLATIQSHSRELRGQRVRIILGKTYLLDRRADEALLTVREIEQFSANGSGSRDILFESTLLKGQSFFQKGDLDRAQLALKSLEQDSPQIQDPALLSQFYGFRFELGVDGCRKISKSGPLSELQVQQQLTSRSTCLLEKLEEIHPLFLIRDRETLKKTPARIITAFEELAQTYRHLPPPPPLAQKKKRTQKELQRYTEELELWIKPKIKSTLAQAQDLVLQWQSEAKGVARDSLNEVLNGLKNLKS